MGRPEAALKLLREIRTGVADCHARGIPVTLNDRQIRLMASLLDDEGDLESADRLLGACRQMLIERVSRDVPERNLLIDRIDAFRLGESR